MKAKKQIIAVGGGGFTHNEDGDLDQFCLDQIGKKNCSIGFLPTASTVSYTHLTLPTSDLV